MIDGKSLSLEDLWAVADGGVELRLHDQARQRMIRAREVLEKMAEKGPVYGFNTGVGKLADKKLKPDQLREFQKNILLSHATGTGPAISPAETRAVMLLRANTLAAGHSGARPELVEFLIELLNRDILPFIPSKGSVGASGDLAPLAHMALVFVDQGQVLINGSWEASAVVLRREGLKPPVLEAREGLALINGTQFSAGVLAIALRDALTLANAADLSAAISFVAGGNRPEQFHPDIARLRPHPGQVQVAENLHDMVSWVKTGQRVQDPYSLRCVPQVHGAAVDALDFVRKLLEIEINSVTDNPVVVDNKTYSCGNFHGQHMGLAGDLLCMAAAFLASMSERRTYLLLSGVNGLPEFLAENPGIQTGLMMLQVTQAALVSENKSLAHPKTLDSIPTSGGQEDFVSMSALSAIAAKQVVDNAWNVIASEFIAGFQALRIKKAELKGALSRLIEDYEKAVKPGSNDRLIQDEVQKTREFLRKNALS